MYPSGNSPVTGTAVPNGTCDSEACQSVRAIISGGHAYTIGAMTEQRTYGGSPAQRWNVTNLGNGYYSIINMASGRSLDVWELSPDLGASIAQWEYWAGDGQQWGLESVGDGYFRIGSRLSGR